MIGLSITVEERFDALAAAEARAAKRALAIFGFRVRAKAQSLIKRRPPGSDAAAPPGSPPLTRAGQLPRAILYFADSQAKDVIIGTSNARLGEVGGAMELGGLFRGHEYEPRPFLEPAFQAELGTMSRELAGSVAE